MLKQKLIDEVNAECARKINAIEDNEERIRKTAELVEILNAVAHQTTYSPIITVHSSCGSSMTRGSLTCTILSSADKLGVALHDITSAGLNAGAIVPTYPDDPNPYYRRHRSISVDGYDGIRIEVKLSEVEALAAA